jgi:hypothetical protein
MAGWVYDWQRHAWMDNAPSAAPVAPSRPPFVPHGPIATPHPAPQSPAPAPIAPQPQPPAHAPEKEEVTTMEKHPHNALDALIKHPIAPLIGGVLVLAAQFTDEPSPPVIPQDLPEPVAKQWQMIFNQNQQRFQRRMDLYEQLGMVLLGYASTNAVLAALPAKKAALHERLRHRVDGGAARRGRWKRSVHGPSRWARGACWRSDHGSRRSAHGFYPELARERAADGPDHGQCPAVAVRRFRRIAPLRRSAQVDGDAARVDRAALVVPQVAVHSARGAVQLAGRR